MEQILIDNNMYAFPFVFVLIASKCGYLILLTLNEVWMLFLSYTKTKKLFSTRQCIMTLLPCGPIFCYAINCKLNHLAISCLKGLSKSLHLLLKELSNVSS